MRRTLMLLAIVLAAMVAVAALIGLVVWLTARPANDRTWVPEQARLPSVTFHGDRVTIHDVRNFRYPTADSVLPAYDDRIYDLDAIRSVSLVISPFSKRWRGPAHAFLSFGFADSQYVAISVEARKEQGEAYSMWRGMLRRFELMYVVGDERDLIGLRAVTWGDPVYVYPIHTTPEKIRRVFTDMLERADALRRRPEFYNTFTNNCTTAIIQHANQVADPPIPYGWRVLLPGYVDGLAAHLGLLDEGLTLEQARARYLVNGRARRYLEDPAFSVRIRQRDGE